MTDPIESLIASVGATAEMSLTFYRSAIDAGANREEARTMLDSFMRAVIFGNRESGGSGE